MFIKLVENAARLLVNGSIRDEALGDLWEFNSRLRESGASNLVRLIKFIQYFLSLVKASAILLIEERITQTFSSNNSLYMEKDICSAEDENRTRLTAEEIKRVEQYCNVRRLYNPSLTRKFLRISDEQDSYWIRQADRLIEKCQSQGYKDIKSEAITNSLKLSSLIRKVETMQPHRVDIDSFGSWVKSIDLNNTFIERYVSFDERSYKRQLICRTWSLVIYVISWMPGQESGIHHHGLFLDAIRVIRGQMTHWLVPPEDSKESIPFEGIGEPRRHDGPSEVFSTGDLVLVDRLHGHQIANLSSEKLVTLHFRFGHPPEDGHWRSTNDTEMFVWNQTEGCFDMLPPSTGRYASSSR